MRIPSKESVIQDLQQHFDTPLYKVHGKQLFYSGKLSNGKELLICTPESKLYPRGHWWVDLTTVQISLLEQASHAIMAFRVEGDKVYYIRFDLLKKLLVKDYLKNNSREGDHWKLHIWPNYIQVMGNDQHLSIQPNRIDNLDVNEHK